MSIIDVPGSAALTKRVALVPIEGVLRKPVGGQVNEDGIYLFRAIAEWYRVILTTYDTRSMHTVEWLEREGIFRYDDILYGDMCINITESYIANMVRIVRQRGTNISLAVVNGPQDALDAINAGVPVLMYTQPAYALPEWLPGSPKAVEPWASLVDKIETQRSARINDRRMDEHLE